MRCRTERSLDGNAGRDGNLPPRPPRPMGRTKHWRTGRGAPDRPDGRKYGWCERQYRTARHKTGLAPSALDDWLDQTLADGRSFLQGPAAGLADLAAYHPVWFLRQNFGSAAAPLDGFPRLLTWA